MSASTTKNHSEDETHEIPTARYLTFEICRQSYGLPILRVQEIIAMVSVTHVPRTPKFVRGVINLRGKIIPVIDMRTLFELKPEKTSGRLCIVVVEIQVDDNTPTKAGLLVDEVLEVLDVPAGRVHEPPALVSQDDDELIQGVAKMDDRVVILIDLDHLLSKSERGILLASG